MLNENFECTCSLSDPFYLHFNDYIYSDQNFGKFFYKFYKEMDWNSAKNKCEQDGATLLVPKSIEECQYFASLMSSSLSSSSEIWLGVNDLANEGEYVDNNNEPITFHNWNYGEPNNVGNEDAVILRNDATWNDFLIYKSRSTLCVLFV